MYQTVYNLHRCTTKKRVCATIGACATIGMNMVFA